MEKKEAIKVLASVSTVIAATGLASVANANQQEALKTEVDALSSKVTVQALKAAENKQSVAVQAVNTQQDIVNQAITEEEKAEKTEATAKEALDEAQIIKDKGTPAEIENTKQNISETESAIENQDVQFQNAQAETAKAQDKVNKQTEIVNSDQTKITTQETNVANAKADVETAQKNLDGTGAKEIISERDNAQSDLATKKAAEANAKSKLEEAQKADADKKAKLEQAEKDEKLQVKAVEDTSKTLSDAEAKSKQTKEQLNNANIAVTNAQAALDGTGAKEIISERDNAQSDLATKKAAESKAQSNLEEAQKTDVDKKAKIQTLTETLTAQQNVALRTSTELTAAIAVAADAKSKKEEADKAVKRLEDKLTSLENLSTIEIPEEVASAYRNFYEDKSEANKDKLFDAVQTWWDNRDYSKENNYPVDDTVINDLSDLTKEQIANLSLYQAGLIQQVRKTIWDDSEILVTEDVVTAMKNITTAYSNMSNPDGDHLFSALTNDGTDTTHWKAENLGYIKAKPTTMSALYKGIYKSIINTFGSDYNQNYAHIITTVGGKPDYKNGKVTPNYIGAATSVTPEGLGLMHEIHFNHTSSDTDKILSNPFDSSVVKTQLADAKAVQTSADNANKTAQNRLNTASVANNVAQDAVSNTTKTLNALKAIADLTPDAKAKLDEATEVRKNAETRLNNAQKAFDNLNSDVATKTKALANAKIAQEKANNANKVANEELNSAQVKNKLANEVLSETRNKIASLKATADLTPDAKIKLAEATSARELAELRLVKAQKAVNNLNSDVESKTKALADAKATLQKEEAKLEELKAQKAKDEKELASLQETVNALKVNEFKIKDEIKSLKTKLQETKDYLRKLESADSNLEKAKVAYKLAVEKHKEAKSILNKETEKLKQLLINKRDAVAQYEAVKEAYTQAQVKAQYEAIVQKGGTPVAILDENGQIVGYNSSFSRDVRTAVRTITDNVVSKHGVPIYQASLPETGEGETAVYTLSGITFLALAGVMRKKKL
ncbi:SEC10/PgrA surface exclusion domain-containing protein [Streptococcus vestibularis]|uniref:SEC10/PgrA surface exclusion domain-containing protein n=1 Tax=Streptococcus vestibularis TaxID=1343 RepID=UPI00242D4344|nr:SEC10/PgrA surface exclusion domain-containing protein [Streptococcus vestibularis]MCI5925308.1 SEC10/PgrA surface exclusion domain-containing protein [Streptococcus vestibularis]